MRWLNRIQFRFRLSFMVFMIFTVFPLLLLTLLFSVQGAWAAHFQGVTPTMTMVDFIGYITIDGWEADLGDEIGVFDDQGLLVGSTIITTKGQYGILHVYGDDPTTPRHDGADSNSVLTFKLWQASSGTETTVTQNMMSTQSLGDFVPSAIPPQWTADKNKYAINIVKKVEIAKKVKAAEVPLLPDWRGMAIMIFLLCGLAGYIERKRGMARENLGYSDLKR